MESALIALYAALKNVSEFTNSPVTVALADTDCMKEQLVSNHLRFQYKRGLAALNICHELVDILDLERPHKDFFALFCFGQSG